MDTLSLQLFRGFTLRRDGQPLPATRTRKEQWLLALLVLRSPQPLERAWLAATLWPDSSDLQARSLLRHSLSNLRAVLGPDAFRLVSKTSSTLRFDVSGMQVDVLAFDAAIASKPETECPSQAHSPRRAAARRPGNCQKHGQIGQKGRDR